MRKCPQCDTAHKTLPLEGWLVYGRATLATNEEDDESLVAIIPTLTHNTAGYQKYARATCGNCEYKGPLSSFLAVHTCILTGEVAATQMTLLGNSVWVASDAVESVQKLNAINLFMDWNSLQEQLNVSN